MWEIHGGGFYRVEKFKVAPERLPDPLHWFKWEAYTTWLSGFALLIVVFYAHASTFLVDPSVADLTTWEAIVHLDRRARARLARLRRRCAGCSPNDERLLAVLRLRVHRARRPGAPAQLFAARAAYIQVGAMLGTIMVGERLLRDHPGARELVRAKEDGRAARPEPGTRAARQRSVHNNYLTLPVVFAMLSDHFPFTYGHTHAWLILVALMALGALTRHYFNLRHKGRNVWWILVVAAAGLLALALADRAEDSSTPSAGAAPRPVRPGAGDRRSSAAPRATRCTRPAGHSAPPSGSRSTRGRRSSRRRR